MAITIEHNPPGTDPVYNPVEFLISSTNVAQPNFVYIVDVYINGSGTKTARLRVPQRPSDTYAVVDVHRVLEATVTSDVGDITNIAGTVDTTNSTMTYILKFGEEYGTTPVVYPNLTVDTSRTAFNGSLEKREWINWSVTDYNFQDTTKKWLTNSPSNLTTSINDYGWLYFIEKTALTKIDVVTYDSSGSTIGTWSIDPTASSSTIQYVPSNPASLNLIDNANLLVGVQPIITSSVASYTIIGYNGVTPISETKTFTIREACKTEMTRLIFQGKLGSYDGFNFYLASNYSYEIEKKMYKKNPDNVSGTSLVYSMSDKEKVQYYTKQTPTLTVTSDWLTQEEDAWLLELIESPVIYIQTSDGLEYVAKVKGTTHKKRKHVTEKLFNLTVELELGYDNYRQRG